MSRTGDAWRKVREAGGSVLGPEGENLTGDADSEQAFQDFMKGFCSNVGKLHDALSVMEAAADRAAEIARYNALPTTKPKCHSKPIIRLNYGCEAEYSFVARNKNERECS